MNTLRGIVGSIPEPQRGYLASLFKRLPPGTEEALSLRRVAAGHTLLRMDEEASWVYILVEGRVRALNERRSGDVYAFASFVAPSLLGEFEAFAGSDRYRGSIACISDCAFLVLSTAAFLAWMRRDPEALFMRAEQITRQLVDQASNERRFRFFPAAQRILIYVTEAYARTERRGVCRILASRQEIADETGFSVKTVQRCLNALRAEGLVSFKGRALAVDAAQNGKLLERLSRAELDSME